MPVRLATSPNGHGFAALWVEFPRPPQSEKDGSASGLRRKRNRPFRSDAVRRALLFVRTASTAFLRIKTHWRLHRSAIPEPSANRDSIKSKIFGRGGGGLEGAGRTFSRKSSPPPPIFFLPYISRRTWCRRSWGSDGSLPEKRARRRSRGKADGRRPKRCAWVRGSCP